MLNCFYWYAFMWLLVLGLYSFNISSFSLPLNAFTVLFFVVTILISLFFGINFKNCFKFKEYKIDKDPSSIPVIILYILFVLDIIYAKELPLLSVAILRTSTYGNFNAIPMVHIVIIAFTSYYAQRYFYLGICNSEYRKKLFVNYFLLMALFLGYFLRSQISYNLFISGIITLEYLRYNKRLDKKNIFLLAATVVIFLYMFGGLGNLRISGSWNDSTYIFFLGGFNVDYNIFPEQFLWSYLYMISPLTNLNYNITHSEGGFDLLKYIAEFMPETFSKRLGVERATTLLYQPYFTVSTGFCRPYITLGVVGMILFFLFVSWIIIIGIQQTRKNKNPEKAMIYHAVSCMIMFFMFFTNTIFENGSSWLFIISLLSLFINVKSFIKMPRVNIFFSSKLKEQRQYIPK